jgi:hypothetical protein
VARRPGYSPGPGIPDDEILRDRQGRSINDACAEAAAEEALAVVRGRGPLPQAETGESPLLRISLSRDLDEAITRAVPFSGCAYLGKCNIFADPLVET